MRLSDPVEILAAGSEISAETFNEWGYSRFSFRVENGLVTEITVD